MLGHLRCAFSSPVGVLRIRGGDAISRRLTIFRIPKVPLYYRRRLMPQLHAPTLLCRRMRLSTQDLENRKHVWRLASVICSRCVPACRDYVLLAYLCEVLGYGGLPQSDTACDFSHTCLTIEHQHQNIEPRWISHCSQDAGVDLRHTFIQALRVAVLGKAVF